MDTLQLVVASIGLALACVGGCLCYLARNYVAAFANAATAGWCVTAIILICRLAQVSGHA